MRVLRVLRRILADLVKRRHRLRPAQAAHTVAAPAHGHAVGAAPAPRRQEHALLPVRLLLLLTLLRELLLRLLSCELLLLLLQLPIGLAASKVHSS